VKCIYILPIGPIDGAVLRTVAQEIRLRLGYQCTIIQSLGEPAYAFEPSREQYSSGRILKEILKNERLCSSSKGTVKVLGIVDVDLCTPILTFVFGEALHELGHTFGLVHCSNPRCVMYFSSSVRNIDVKTNNFCDSCAMLLSEKKRRVPE
jgi:archaemetzincin